MNTNENIWLFMGGIAAIVLVGFIMHPALGVLLLLGSIPLTLWLKANNWSITTTKTSPINPNQNSESQGMANQDNSLIINEDDKKFGEKMTEFAGGILLAGITNILAYVLAIIILGIFIMITGVGAIFIFLLFFIPIGLVQLLYIIPLVLKLRKRGNKSMSDGVIAGAILTAIFNALIYLYFSVYGL